MKMLRSIPALLVAILFAFQASAFSGDEQVTAEASFAYSVHSIKGAKKFMLAFENHTDAKVIVKIYDAAHNLLFTDSPMGEEIAKVYDLSSVGAGEYTVAIHSGDFDAEEHLSVGMPAKNVAARSFEAIVAPDAHNAHKMRVSFGNAIETVDMVVTSASGNVVYEGSFSGQANYNQVFNLERLPTGLYMVSITSGEETITQSYAVK